MTLRFLCAASVFILIAAFSGCGSGNGEEPALPADLVTNPNSAEGDKSRGTLPVIEFEETEHDFGKIIEGESVSYDFVFKNTGKSDLLIAEVSSSCGCTVPSYPKTPIRPGETGKIKVSFSSAGRRGMQSKNVVVVSNTQPNTALLTIRAQVVSPGAE